MIKLLVGLLKGAVIGAAVGYGAYSSSFHAMWLVCGVVGALVGLLVGRPIWALITDKNATTVAAALKTAVGFGVGVGLWAIVEKAWSPPASIVNVFNVGGQNLFAVALAGAIGAVYGAFVEIDDAVGHDPSAKDGAGSKALVAKKK